MEPMNASDEQTQTRLPRIGEPVPQFEATTTQGAIRLEDFKESWLVLFSHPADFTPVCTTEFIAFSEIQAKLREMNCELMGLSIDSVFAHIAWIRNIEEKMGAKITFPVIADLDKAVAGKYGMVMPGESKVETSRCVFIIDDKQILRAMISNPMTPEEISSGLGEPLYKVRSSLREMGTAGLISEADGRHAITELGKEALSLG